MAELIYRSVAHDGIKAFAAQAPRILTYRGVRHDGMAVEPARTLRHVPMRYRGAVHAPSEARTAWQKAATSNLSPQLQTRFAAPAQAACL